MTFQTKAGRALAAAFAPEQKGRITKPDAANQVRKDRDGQPVPIDRTADGVHYQAEADEQLVKE